MGHAPAHPSPPRPSRSLTVLVGLELLGVGHVLGPHTENVRRCRRSMCGQYPTNPPAIIRVRQSTPIMYIMTGPPTYTPTVHYHHDADIQTCTSARTQPTGHTMLAPANAFSPCMHCFDILIRPRATPRHSDQIARIIVVEGKSWRWRNTIGF